MLSAYPGTHDATRRAPIGERDDPAGKEVMTHEEMLKAHPKELSGFDLEKLADCIAACFECAQACTACADACLSEDMVAELATCIRTNLDCADVCVTTGKVLSRQTGSDKTVIKAVLEVCATACEACGTECAKHAHMHEHCRICAEACKRCEEACQELIASL